MSKCPVCNSCLRPMKVYENEYDGCSYFVCAFCKIIFDDYGIIVKDKLIIEIIGKQRGWKIE